MKILSEPSLAAAGHEAPSASLKGKARELQAVVNRAVANREKNWKQEHSNIRMLLRNCPGYLRQNPKRTNDVMIR